MKTDVAVWDDLERMFRTADEEFGGADIVSLTVFLFLNVVG